MLTTKRTESAYFERCRLTLTNSKNDPMIWAVLQDFGTTQEHLDEGWAIYNSTRALWNQVLSEHAESLAAGKQFRHSLELLRKIFRRHRNMALIYFDRYPEVLILLGVKGDYPVQNIELLDAVEFFYNAIKNNVDVQQHMAKIKITPEIADEGLALLNTVLLQRSMYDQEMAEAQDLTKSKDAALDNLRNWMQNFHATARVALYDHPQKLEALGIFVRS